MRKNTIYSKLFFALFLLAIAVLVFNVLFLAITGKHLLSGQDIAYYAKEVRSETVKTIKADRGGIYSFNGDLIATDRQAFNVTVYLSPDRPGYGDEIAYVDKPEITAKVLSKYLSDWSEKEILKKLTDEDLYQYTFKSYISSVQMNNLQTDIETNQLHGIEFSKTSSRNYQYGHFSSYIIGLVNLNDDDPDHVKREGAFGIESAWNDELNGTDGEMVYQADVAGRAIYNARLSESPAVNGSDIYLSLDNELQNMLEVQLDSAMRESGAKQMWCGIMDAHTGRMLAMASRPDFNLQKRSTLERYTDLFMTESYEVGSVIKPFVYLTAMKSNVYDGDERYMSGKVYVDGASGSGPIQDHNSGEGWGKISYDEGLIRSSNTAITRLIQEKMEFKDLEETFEKLGFFQNHTVDGLDVASGWANYVNTQSPYDRVTLGFGQSATYTAFHILRAFSVFANDGKIVEPYFVDRVIDANGQTTYSAQTKMSEQIFAKEDIEHIRDLLTEVVNNDDIGTGTTYQSDDVKLFGKTGTGEYWDVEANRYSNSTYYYTFAGGAPADDPEVIVVIGMLGDESSPNTSLMADILHTMIPQALAKLNVTEMTNIDKKVTDFTIGSFVNQSVSYAKKRLKAEGLECVVIGDGTVVKKQLPEANANISTANTVYLLTDASSYKLPNFKGWSRRDIASYMQLFGIHVNFEGSGKAKKQSVKSGTDISTITELTIELGD